VKRTIITLLTAMALALFGWALLFAGRGTFSVVSPSMAPTFEPEDVLVIEPDSEVHRGDAIVFEQQWDRSPGQQPTWLLRVIGVPGDVVGCCTDSGSLSINGTDHPGLDPVDDQFEARVQPGQVFLVGDNREGAHDSRVHLSENGGGAPASSVRGKVVGTVWPLWNWSISSRSPYSEMAGNVPAQVPWRFIAGSLFLALVAIMTLWLLTTQLGSWWREHRSLTPG
jgi:signal peptidase I